MLSAWSTASRQVARRGWESHVALGRKMGRQVLPSVSLLLGPSQRSTRGFVMRPKKKSLQQMKRDKKKARELEERKLAPKDLHMPIVCTPKSLSHAMGIRAVDILKEMIKMDLEPKSADEILDPTLSDLLVEEFYFKPKRETRTVDVAADTSRVGREEFPNRPPVVVITGHVDHGKTSLLDALRNTSVAEKEAGGITQHISAFSVRANDQDITFIDTPGHAAFQMMRSRGLQVADVTIVVIAADTGIQEQTDEVLDSVIESGATLVVAVNKIDKSNADPDMVYKQLASRGLQPEQLGGDVQCVEVSAVEGIGLEELVEAVQLQAEMMDLRADVECRAEGVVTEMRKDRGRGLVASLITRCGTLREGDIFVSGSAWGKVRTVYNPYGENIGSSGPGTPVEVSGIKKNVPVPGDDLIVVKNVDQAKEIMDYRSRTSKLLARAQEEMDNAAEERELQAAMKQTGSSAKGEEDEEADAEEEAKTVVRVALKADVPGSVEAIRSVVDQLPLEEFNVEVDLHSTGVGHLTQNDVRVAKALKALLLGFNVYMPPDVVMASKSEGWPVHQCSIIYEAASQIAAAVEEVLPPLVETHTQGKAEVKTAFPITVRSSKKMIVAGCLVETGMMARRMRARLIRGTEVLHAGRVESLKSFKKDVKEVKQNNECGIRIVGWDDYHPGDIIECYTTTSTPQKLELPDSLAGPRGRQAYE